MNNENSNNTIHTVKKETAYKNRSTNSGETMVEVLDSVREKPQFHGRFSLKLPVFPSLSGKRRK